MNNRTNQDHPPMKPEVFEHWPTPCLILLVVHDSGKSMKILQNQHPAKIIQGTASCEQWCVATTEVAKACLVEPVHGRWLQGSSSSRQRRSWPGTRSHMPCLPTKKRTQCCPRIEEDEHPNHQSRKISWETMGKMLELLLGQNGNRDQWLCSWASLREPRKPKRNGTRTPCRPCQGAAEPAVSPDREKNGKIWERWKTINEI